VNRICPLSLRKRNELQNSTTRSPGRQIIQHTKYLRYAVLRLLEGEADEISTDVPEIGGVTVGYGEDEAMFDSWGDDVEWWDIVPPRESVPVSGSSTLTSTKSSRA